MIRTAEISACQRYRYSLKREWDVRLPKLIVCMLNPSRADAERDDPTILRLIAFAKSWGYGGLEVINLRSWRASRPRDLFAAEAEHLDTVGAFTAQYWERAARQAHDRGTPILIAWGNNAPETDVADFLETMGPDIELICLGHTNLGAPIHPAARGRHRVPDDIKPVRFKQRKAKP